MSSYGWPGVIQPGGGWPGVIQPASLTVIDEVADSTIVFSHEAVGTKLVVATVESTIVFDQETVGTKLVVATVESTIVFDQEVLTSNTFDRLATDTLIFNETVIGNLDVQVNQSLNFLQLLEYVKVSELEVVSTLTLNQSVAVGTSGSASDSLNFLQLLECEKLIVRSITSTLTLTQEPIASGAGMPDILIRTASSDLLITHGLSVSNGATLPIYGSLEKANNYFSLDLNGQRWMYSDYNRRVQALVKATKLIDRLNFVGVRTSDDQPLQFPRGTDTLVPVDIEQACYEVAIALLSGVDPNTERDNLSMTVQAYGGLRSEFDRSSILPYMTAGIPSATAWNLLLPYLEENRGIEFRRVS